jgi:hypothetical protein
MTNFIISGPDALFSFVGLFYSKFAIITAISLLVGTIIFFELIVLSASVNYDADSHIAIIHNTKLG